MRTKSRLNSNFIRDFIPVSLFFVVTFGAIGFRLTESVYAKEENRVNHFESPIIRLAGIGVKSPIESLNEHGLVIKQEIESRIEQERIEEEQRIKAEEERITQEELQKQIPGSTWNGSVLTAQAGVNYGPTGKETYYNMEMSGVISMMRNMGFTESEYPYWVRDDGVKMLGNYVIVAANLNTFPRGSIVECSLGTALVCDTGGFAAANPTMLDIATAW